MAANHPSASQMPPDLSDGTVRRRLGPAALKAVSRIMRFWGASAEETRQLLALAPEASAAELDPAQLGEEQMLRISYLVGIYKALHTLWSDTLADQWIGLPNMNAMFEGQNPLKYMADGGIEALRNVRNLLDARCAGT